MSPSDGRTAALPVDIRADLQSEDETGFVWTFLRHAADPAALSAGATVIAGNSAARALAEIVDIVDGPGDKIVHLRLLDGSVKAFEAERAKLNHAS
jgi:hypothetical protein